MPHPHPSLRRRRPARRIIAQLTALLLAATVAGARAQSVTDGSDAAISATDTAAVLTLIAGHLRTTDARVTGLRRGRFGAICGAVDVRNRMGDYAGPRPFVADLDAGFAGRLPEGPELRSPAGPAEYRALDRAKLLFARACAGG